VSRKTEESDTPWIPRSRMISYRMNCSLCVCSMDSSPYDQLAGIERPSSRILRSLVSMYRQSTRGQPTALGPGCMALVWCDDRCVHFDRYSVNQVGFRPMPPKYHPLPLAAHPTVSALSQPDRPNSMILLVTTIQTSGETDMEEGSRM